MNNQKSNLIQYGAGWVKSGKDGNDFISGVVDKKLKVFLQNEAGEMAEVENFVIFYSNKTDKQGVVHENWPDVRFCANLKSE